METDELLAQLGIDSSVPVTEKPVDHLDRVQELVLSLMKEHGLTDAGWTFKWDRAERRAGECRFDKKNGNSISLSRPLMSIWTTEQAKETILHEIAHALAGPKHNHDWTWKMRAMEIGAKPVRCWGENGERRIEGSYLGTCPNGHTITRFRKTAKMDRISCAECSSYYDPRFHFTWVKVGEN